MSESQKKTVAQTVKKDPYDKTSGKRANEHLKRLAEQNGKRLPVDLSAAHVAQLADLVAAGCGPTSAAVIRKAIEQMHATLKDGVAQPTDAPSSG